MSTYIIKELQNANSDCRGDEIEAADWDEAKRIAEDSQVFQGTVLRIEAENGRGLAYKEDGKRWIDYPSGPRPGDEW